MNELEREVYDLRRANVILRKASAFRTSGTQTQTLELTAFNDIHQVRFTEPIENSPPIEFEKLFYQRQDVPVMAVGNT